MNSSFCRCGVGGCGSLPSFLVCVESTLVGPVCWCSRGAVRFRFAKNLLFGVSVKSKIVAVSGTILVTCTPSLGCSWKAFFEIRLLSRDLIEGELAHASTRCCCLLLLLLLLLFLCYCEVSGTARFLCSPCLWGVAQESDETLVFSFSVQFRWK